MIDELVLPRQLMINAYAGPEPVSARPSPDTKDWLLSNAPPKIRAFLKAAPRADPRNWRDERVGWGLVLPHNAALPPEKWSTAEDAPEPIRALVEDRGQQGEPAPVLRYRRSPNRIGFLHRDGADLPVVQSPYGTTRGAVPRYLLLYGTPEQIPWEEQYNLNATRAVGRLALEGTALENYVQALMSNWKGASANQDSALLWAVDHGESDITSLMRRAVAEQVLARLRKDTTVGPNTHYLDGSIAGTATAAKLKQGLAEHKPGFVLTTSHGQTGPLDNIEQMRANLGLLVDTDHSLVTPPDVLDGWKPGGAIWYAHACCSAGSDAQTLFNGLVEQDSMVDRVLKGVAKVGAQVAPLPTALLGASDPLRAFVGHVEPTFDWTLQQNVTKQFTTDPIATALYDELYQPSPVGFAMSTVYGQLGGIYAEFDQFSRLLNQPKMLHRLLVARDIQSMVILGDPTAMLPIT
jgi:hypothetical protein